MPSRSPLKVREPFRVEEVIVFPSCGHNRPFLGRSYFYFGRLASRMYQVGSADAFLTDRVRAHDTRAVSSSWALLKDSFEVFLVWISVA